MRIALAAIVILIGVNVGLSTINKMQDINDQKMDKICQIDPSYCK